MIKKTISTCFVLFSSLVFSQNLIDLNDSIRYYTIADPQKSLQFARQAIQTNTFEEDNLQSYNTNYLITQVFFYNEYYQEAVEYALNCLKIYENLTFKEKSTTNDSNPGWLFLTIGNVYYKVGNNDKAKTYWIRSRESFKTSNVITEEEKQNGFITVDLNLALISIDKKNYDEAFEYYNKILNGIINNNIQTSQLIYLYNQFMNLHIKLDNSFEAKKYFELVNEGFYEIDQNFSGKSSSSLEFAVQKRHYVQTIIDYSRYLISKDQIQDALSELLIIKKNTDINSEAISQINILISECNLKSDQILKAEIGLLDNFNTPDLSTQQILETQIGLSKVYEQKGGLKKLLNIKDSIIHYQKLQKNKNENLKNVEILLELDEKQRELSKNKVFYNNAVFILCLVLVSLTVIIIIYRINFKLQNEKNKRLRSEKLKMENELSLKKKELFSKSNFILQRNEFLKTILDNIDYNDSQKSISVIKKKVSSAVKSENLYKEFDKKFVEVFPKFYKKMNLKYNLSKTDFRLIAYIKMNKSNNEIAQISGISLRTVQSQRYRLSKKLKLEKYQDLNSFIFSL